MMSSRFDRSFTATISYLLKLVLIFLGVTVLLCSISFVTACKYTLFLWCLFGNVHFLFLLCLNSLISSSLLLFVLSLKYVLCLIRLKNVFKPVCSSFLLYTFGAGIKFKFLFKSLYSVLVKKCLVKSIIFGLNQIDV